MPLLLRTLRHGFVSVPIIPGVVLAAFLSGVAVAQILEIAVAHAETGCIGNQISNVGAVAGV